jgi:hypothetical protein
MKKIDNVDLSNVTWRSSSRGSADGQRVEVASLPDGFMAVRDSLQPEGPALIFTPAEWEAFVGGVQDGEFDL